MALKYNLRLGSCLSNNCNDLFGCPQNICPDFSIRRHDTKPVLKISFEDCDGPMDFRGLVIECNMWAITKIKDNITETDDYFKLVDNIGFNQIMVGDIIVVDQIRNPEKMLVLGFDEHNKFIQVQRGYHGTNPAYIKKGTILRIFRILNGQATSEMIFEDIQNVDGTTTENVLRESYLIYEWQPNDTCLPGCYWFEFKVLKMFDTVWYLPGGYWAGSKFQKIDGQYVTGSLETDSSVVLSFNQVENKYFIPQLPWQGELHLHTDNKYYTGSSHDDGSVLLNNDGMFSDNDSYNENGLIAFHNVSIIPSFTDISLTPSDFSCVLGEGVEWVRRFPTKGEGFLIKIEFSPTTELS